MAPRNNRSNLRQNEQAHAERQRKAARIRDRVPGIKCRIVEFWKPGAQTTFEGETPDKQRWRVALIPEDFGGLGFARELSLQSFPLAESADVIMGNYGDGPGSTLQDKIVYLKFNGSGPGPGSEVSLAAIASNSTAGLPDASDVAKGSAWDLGEIFNFSFG